MLAAAILAAGAVSGITNTTMEIPQVLLGGSMP
jgi:hypothetical protein